MEGLKDYYEVEGCKIVGNAKVYDLKSSVMASKYPMTLNPKGCSDEITKRTVSLGSSKPGSGHDQFLSTIYVNFDLSFSKQAWNELTRYRFIFYCSSQSVIHRVTRMNIEEQCNEYVTDEMIELLNKYIEEYNNNPSHENYLRVVYNAPTGLVLTARISASYRALKTVVQQRSSHKLLEWRELCQWIHTLPHFDELTQGLSKEE